VKENISIYVEGLGKRYQLGQTVDFSRTFREVIMALPAVFGQKAKRAVSKMVFCPGKRCSCADPNEGDSETPSGTFWALRDINLEIEQGSAVGIIGRNGAGKSTLLKILSRITTPTAGHVQIRGRVGSLLEVGTGFHPELTGRENIYLNGAILGMRKMEIESKFDAIVEFAEVQKFIDTPVKRYSSGMYVRLAFAVAAHLEPEVLLVDEVLAVGDVNFQKKCLGKMETVTEQGLTVIFVSHNMGAVRRLCSTCLWIDKGRIVEYGTSASVIESYLKSGDDSEEVAESIFEVNTGKQFQLRAARVVNHEGLLTQKFDCDKPVCIEFDCQVHKPVAGLYGYLSISRKDGTEVLVSDSFDVDSNPLDNLPVGMHLLKITIPPRTLGPGDYEVFVNFTSPFGDKGFHVDSPGVVCGFHLDDYISNRGNNRGGFFSILLPWNVRLMS
jgi:lipopolysaccharide transport system ATP-binding protein